MQHDRIIKPEASNIRATCVVCGKNPQKSKGIKNKNGEKLYLASCRQCHHARYGMKPKKDKNRTRTYRRFKKSHCEHCGFIPYHSVQLDIDHIDGNRYDHTADNIWTLCSNCHRVKTLLERQTDEWGDDPLWIAMKKVDTVHTEL